MATIGSDLYTMADWVKEHNPDGSVKQVLNVLMQENAIAEDMVSREGNLPTGHTATIMAGLPDISWYGFNEGPIPSKGVDTVETFETGQVGSRSEIAVALAKLGGNPDRARFSKAVRHLEAIKQGVASMLLYGDPVVNPLTDVKAFPGFHFFYKDNTTGAAKQNIIDAAGNDSDLTTIWLVEWGEGCYGIYNKGTQFGINHMDRGIQDVRDSVTGQVRTVFADVWEQNLGLVIEDWRRVVRIANLDISAIKANTSSARDKIIEYMVEAYHTQQRAGGRSAFYVNKTIATQLHIAAMNKTNVNLSIREFAGKPVTAFLDIPIRNVDALRNTEARVV